MDAPASLPAPATSILSGATIQTAERNEFNNTGGNMTKIIVQNFTIDPGSTQARAKVTSDTSREGCEYPVSDTARSSLDIYSFVSFFLSLIFTRAALPSPSGAGETTCLDEPPVIVSEIPLDDPLALPIPEASCSPSHMYTRSMLEKGIGYPLYEPQPDCEPSSEYWGKGVRVGDVGIVTTDGIFDFLFNVCPLQNPSINPPTIPDDFIEELDCQVRVVEHFQPNACLFSSGVNRSQNPGGRYTCLGPNGAILELPVGATRFEAKDKLPLKRLAARDAEKWYRYTILNMGRDAQNGSLYLVTTCIKCRDWGIGVFERPSTSDCLRFIINERLAEPSQTLCPKYSWEGSGAFTTRVTPNPNNLGSNDGDTLNQCVFLRGYKIELRKDIWDNLESPRSTAKFHTTSQFANKGNKSTRKGNSGNQNDCSRSGTRFGPRSAVGTTNLAQDVIEHGPIVFPAEPERVTVHAGFSSSPAHPSDLINTALLSQRLDAKVALTHDDDWCDMMQGNFLELRHEDLSKIALSYTSMLDEFGCVSLERGSSQRLTPPAASTSQPSLTSPSRHTHPAARNVQITDLPEEFDYEAAPSSSTAGASSNPYISNDLLNGVSIGFDPPQMSAQLGTWNKALPTIISLPFGRSVPLHIQAPSWRHMLKLLACLPGTSIQPGIKALAKTKTEHKLRTVIQFAKPHLASTEWRVILWITLEHPAPSNVPGSARYVNDVNVLPWSYTFSQPPQLLRGGPDSQLAKAYTIPGTSSLSFPKLPITCPDLAMYLHAAMEVSRRHSNDSSSGVRKLAKMIDFCYPNANTPGIERRGVGNLFKRVIRRDSNYDLVTPFVADEWG